MLKPTKKTTHKSIKSSMGKLRHLRIENQDKPHINKRTVTYGSPRIRGGRKAGVIVGS